MAKLRLICHGMMAIFYREGKSGGMEKGYTIYIPHPPRDGSAGNHPMHDLRMGVDAGAKTNPAPELVFGATDDEVQEYVLSFERPLLGPTVRGKKDDALGFYVNSGHKVTPDRKHMAFIIHIPHYPNHEDKVRVVDYDIFPYEPTAATKNFKITTKRLVGARVFTFNLKDSTDGITLDRLGIVSPKRHVFVSGPVKDDVRIHLYNQPPVVMKTNYAHIIPLNLMLGFDGKTDGLIPIADPGSHPDPVDVRLPEGLNVRDALHLSEYIAVSGEAGEQHYDRGADKEVIFDFDPADCAQPDGC